MAKAAGKGGAGDPGDGAGGMEKAELKRMLKFASDEPVRVAFALGGDGKAILVMDRRKPARTLEKELKEAVPDSKNHRFGTAAVDAAQPKLVKFMVNKQAGGVARKLVVALKGTGFSKVEVGTEDGGAPERAEEEEGDAAAPDGSVPPGQAGAAASRPPGDDAPPTAEGAAAALPGMAPNAAPGRPAASQPAASQPAASQIQPSQPGQAAPAPGGAAKPDTGAMVAQLVPLVQQIQAIAAKDPAQKAPLTKLATEAQASLRRAMLSLTPGDLDQAAAGIERVRVAVAAAAAPAGHGAPGQAAGHAAGAAQGPGSAPHGGKPLDPAGVTAALTKAAKQAMPVMQSDPSRRPALQQHLAQAHASLKAGDLAAAQGHTDGVMEMLTHQFGGAGGGLGSDFAGGPGTAKGLAAGHAAAKAAGKAAGPPHQPDPLLAKAAQVWDATCTKARGELKRVHDAFVAAADGHGIAEQLGKTFHDAMQPLHQALDSTLARKLHEVNAAADHPARAKAAAEAKGLVEHHRKHTAEHPVLRAIEGNPLVPVAIKALLHAGLDGVEKVLGKHLGPAAGPAASGMGSAGGRASGGAGGRG